MSDFNHTLTLNNGIKMPLVGHGTWKIPNDKIAEGLYQAIKAGYRLFDAAADYGNEVEAGQGIARAIKEGIVKREELFIVSKLWNTYHDRERVEPMVRKQLKDWGLDYFDLYIMHFPIALEYVDPEVRYPPGWFHDGVTPTDIRQSKATIRETWEAMEACVDKGLCRSIGISNFNCIAILDLLHYARIRPATLQIEHHPYLVQKALCDYAQGEGITITAYSSFGPQGYVEMDLKHAIKTPHLFKHPVINKIAQAHGKSAPQVLLRWATQNNIAVIPKADTVPMLLDNLNAKGFDLTKEEIEEINGLDQNLRFNDPLTYFGCLPIFQ
jgi:D-xylose reductase